MSARRYFGTDGRAEGGEKVGYRYVAIHRGRLVLNVISCPYHRDTCEAFGKSGSFTNQSVFPPVVTVVGKYDKEGVFILSAGFQ